MSKNIFLIILLGVSNIFFGQNENLSNPISNTSVIENMERVADWQIEHFRDIFSGRKKPHHIADWTNGALYVGMTKLAKISKDDKYWNFLKGIGEQQKWKLHWRKYMADDHIVGQM